MTSVSISIWLHFDFSVLLNVLCLVYTDLYWRVLSGDIRIKFLLSPGCRWRVWACSWGTGASGGVQRTLWQRGWAAEWRCQSPPEGIHSPVGKKQASRRSSLVTLLGTSRAQKTVCQSGGVIAKGLWTDLKSCEWAELLVTHRASTLKGPRVGDVVTQVVDLQLENKYVFL